MPSIKSLLAKTSGKLTENTRQSQNRSRSTSQQGGSGRTGSNLSDLFGGVAQQLKTVPRADESRAQTPDSVASRQPSFSWPASQKTSRNESKVTPSSHYEALEKGTAPAAPGFAMPWYDRAMGVEAAYADEGGGETQESTAPKTEATGGDFQTGAQTVMNNVYDNGNRDIDGLKSDITNAWNATKDTVENSPQAPEDSTAPKIVSSTGAKKLNKGFDAVSNRLAGGAGFQNSMQDREDFVRNSADPQAAKREEEFERVKDLKDQYDQYTNWYDTMGYGDYYDDDFVREMWRQRYHPRYGQDTSITVMDKVGLLDGLDPGSLSYEELVEQTDALDKDPEAYRKLFDEAARSDRAMRRAYENRIEDLYGAGAETTNGSVYIDDDGQVVVLDANGNPMDPSNPATFADYVMELDMALAGYNDPTNYTYDSYADAQTSGNLTPFERWVENPYTDQFYVPAYYDPDYSWASDDTTHMLGRELDTMGLLNHLAYGDADYTDLDPYNMTDHELLMQYGSSAGGIHDLNKKLVEDYAYGFGIGSDDPNANPLLAGYLQNYLDTDGLLTAWTNLLTMNRMLGRGNERGPARQNVFGWDQSIYDMLFGDNLMTQGGGIVKFTPREKGDIDWGIQGELKGQPYLYSDYNPDQLFSDEFMSDNMIWNTGLSNPYLQTRENYIDNGLGALGFDDDLYNLLEFENENNIARMSKDDYAAYRNAFYGDESGSGTASKETSESDEDSGEGAVTSVLKALTSTEPRKNSTVR